MKIAGVGDTNPVLALTLALLVGLGGFVSALFGIAAVIARVARGLEAAPMFLIVGIPSSAIIGLVFFVLAWTALNRPERPANRQPQARG